MFAIRFLAGSIFCALLICTIAAVKKLFGKHLSLKCHYHIWFLLFPSLLCSFLPDSFFIRTKMNDLLGMFTSEHPAVSEPPTSGAAATGRHAEWMREFTESVTRTDTSFSFSVFNFFIIVWCIGVIISAAVFLLSLIRMRQLTRAAVAVSQETERLLSRCKSQLKMRSSAKIFELDGIDSPFTWGFFRCGIYLPGRLKYRLSPAEIENIVLHELMHIKHRDILLNHVMCLLQILYWFHPFVRKAFARARQDREIYCDYTVMKTFGSDQKRLDYGYTLLNFSDRFSSHALYTAAGIGGTGKHLKERLEAVVDFEKNNTSKAGRSICVILLVSCLALPQLPLLASFADSAALPNSGSCTPSGSAEILPEDLSGYFGDLDGCFVLRSQSDASYMIYRPENGFRRVSPDSTYKIFSALRALEQGIITPNDSKRAWDNTVYSVPEWNKDQDLTSAMRYSVNWYFQSLDRQSGRDELEQFYRDIDYGNADLAGGIDGYWKESSLKISPIEQIELLQNLYENKWNFSRESIEAVKQAMLLSSDHGVRLYGKTGTGRINEKDINGWFIGFLETESDVYFFAANLQGEDGASGSAAAEIVLKVLHDKGILKNVNI